MQNVIILSTNFKYSTVISTFSEHITIFRTLDFWQLKCQQLLSVNFSELSNFSCLTLAKINKFPDRIKSIVTGCNLIINTPHVFSC